MAFLLKALSILPETNFTTYSAQIGSSLEAILFSMALGNRINLLQEDNNRKQADLIIQLRKNETLQTKVNRELEEKVDERTAALKEAQNKLVQQEKLAALGQITAGIAHEIKNPLNFVNNFSELSCELMEEIESTREGKERNELNTLLRNYLKKIGDYGKRADKVVNSMMLHSYSGASVRNKTNVSSICEEAVNLISNSLKPRYRNLNCTIEKNLNFNLPEIKINNHDILKVILGILSNAYYAVYEISLNKHNFIPQISIVTKANADSKGNKQSISILISDNGAGMTDETKEKIFQPFFTNKPTGEGTGLSLSISYDILAAHDGDILFQSELDKGTTFEIILPLTKA